MHAINTATLRYNNLQTIIKYDQLLELGAHLSVKKIGESRLP